MYKPINGFTKAKMIEMINNRMLDHPSRQIRGDGTVSGCMYKAGDGNRCAVGVFIPDGHDAENYPSYVNALLIAHPDLEQFMPLETNALRILQSIHDREDRYVGIKEDR